uniref:Uncharacterized protein n=1 Tax=Oryza meridionalis TaxID=40149 RepID=A0A0E0E600_9ORYZ
MFVPDPPTRAAAPTPATLAATASTPRSSSTTVQASSSTAGDVPSIGHHKRSLIKPLAAEYFTV